MVSLQRLWLVVFSWQNRFTRRPQMCSSSWTTSTPLHRLVMHPKRTLKKPRRMTSCFTVNCALSTLDTCPVCEDTTQIAMERGCSPVRTAPLSLVQSKSPFLSFLFWLMIAICLCLAKNLVVACAGVCSNACMASCRHQPVRHKLMLQLRACPLSDSPRYRNLPILQYISLANNKTFFFFSKLNSVFFHFLNGTLNW